MCTTKGSKVRVGKRREKKKTMVVGADHQDDGKYVAACCGCSVLQLQRASG